MSKDYKQRVQRAIEKNYHRQLKKDKPSTRRNNKPEKEVETSCLKLMRSWGWSVEIYESKATYDPRRGVWRQQSMKSGTLDCMGVTDQGIAVAVEFKAMGRLSSLRDNQREFLISRINQFAFACVVDSAIDLNRIYNQWKYIRENQSLNKSRDYLLLMIPKQTAKRNEILTFE